MATALTETAAALARRVSGFAQRHIAPLSDLSQQNQFPIDLWQAMGREELLGSALSKEYGGAGCSALDICVALHSLVKDGNNLGIGLSFLIHHITAHHVIETWANDHQKKCYLPDLAKGAITACLAVSEPKAGSHPKYLASVAVKEPGGYVLTGEKTFLTNGPIADLFVVIAISAVESERKRFSAFIVPGKTPGLEILPPLEILFFKPAPHGGIRFDTLKVPEEALLGPPDSAYENIVLPVRAIEDALMMGAVTGALEKQALLLGDALKEKQGDYDDHLKIALGKLKTMLETAKIIAYEAAKMIDSRTSHPEEAALTLFFKNLAAEFQTQLKTILKHAGIDKAGLLATLINELALSAKISSRSAKLRQIKLGKAFL